MEGRETRLNFIEENIIEEILKFLYMFSYFYPVTTHDFSDISYFSLEVVHKSLNKEDPIKFNRIDLLRGLGMLIEYGIVGYDESRKDSRFYFYRKVFREAEYRYPGQGVDVT